MSNASVFIFRCYAAYLCILNGFFQHIETLLNCRHIGSCSVSFYCSNYRLGCFHDRRILLLFRKLWQYHTVIYRIYDFDYGLAIILQTLCCTDRVGTRMRMGCINNDGSRLEDTCFYSNRNSLLDKQIQQVHILQAKSAEFGQGTRINQISLLRELIPRST